MINNKFKNHPATSQKIDHGTQGEDDGHTGSSLRGPVDDH
jgi:hypothetical protein